jgi:multicomponent Na+:H+ antiporter subunit C
VTTVLAIAAGALVAAGTYLLLQRALTRVLIGLAILGHAANLVLLIAGGRRGPAPIVSSTGAAPAGAADPLPQALALTAIVITFGVSAFLLALAYRSWSLTHDDEVEDDIEDRRIARRTVRSDEFVHGDEALVEVGVGEGEEGP